MYEFAHPSMALKLCKPYPFSAGYIEFLMTGTICVIKLLILYVFFVSFLDLFNVPVNNFSVMSFERPLPGYYQYFWRENMSCSSTQHGAPNEDRVSSHKFRRNSTNFR